MSRDNGPLCPVRSWPLSNYTDQRPLYRYLHGQDIYGRLLLRPLMSVSGDEGGRRIHDCPDRQITMTSDRGARDEGHVGTSRGANGRLHRSKGRDGVHGARSLGNVARSARRSGRERRRAKGVGRGFHVRWGLHFQKICGGRNGMFDSQRRRRRDGHHVSGRRRSTYLGPRPSAFQFTHAMVLSTVDDRDSSRALRHASGRRLSARHQDGNDRADHARHVIYTLGRSAASDHGKGLRSR